MRLPVVVPPLHRWIPLCLTALLVAAALALFWSAAAPAGAQDGSDTEVPAKPTGLSVATEPGSLEVSVDWDDVDGADDYLVRWRPHDTDQELNDGVRPTSSETTITVADYGRWVLRAQACNDAGCSGASALQFEVEPAPEPTPTPTPTPTPAATPTPTPTPEPPAQPGGLTLDTAAGSLDVGVDWDDVDGADDYLVRWRLHGPDQTLNDGMRPTSSETTITVADYGRWVVRVQACNDAGCGPGISQAADVAPAAPAILAAAATTGALDLSVTWDAVAGADAYSVRWRPPDGNFEADNRVSIAADGAENFNAAITVSDYGDWMVQVEACNGGTCGTSVAPPMSLDISVAAGALSVATTWDAVAGADTYEVRWRQPGEAFVVGDLVETATTGAAITVDDHGTWEVRVRACSGETCGPEVSYEVNVTPARPSSLAVGAGPGALNRSVTWDASVGADTYEVRWGRPGEAFAAGNLVETAATSAAITVDDHGTWEVQVKACDDAGCSGASALRFEVEPAQELLQVSIAASATVVPVGESVTLTAVITDPPAESEPSYKWELDLEGWLSAGTDPTLLYLTSVAESQAFRVTVTYGTEAWGTSDPLTVTWVDPNRAPVVDEQAEKYAAFIDTNNAPRGTLVSKEFGGIFSDPDGDTLTYTVSVPTGRTELVDSVYVQEATQQVFIRMDAGGDWNAVTPALPDPLVTTVTLTATNPEGLSASVSGDFLTQWDSRPVLLSVTASGDAIKLTFDQAVQVSPAPAPSQFTVNVANGDGAAGTIAVDGVAVSGATVTLDLASAIEDGRVITLDYAHDDDTPLKRAASGGDFAPSFTGRTIAPALPEPPGQPGNLAVNPAEESLHLTATWDAVQGATYYQLRWRPSGGDIQASGQVRSTATDTVLEVSGNSATFAVPDDGEWLVSVEACNEGGCGQALEQVAGRQQTTTAPDFGSATVSNQSYVQGTAITNLVLPAATGGDGTLTYTLSPNPPAGLTFTAGTRTLSGTPSAGQGATEYTYTVTDTDGDTDSLTFKIAVSFGCTGSTAVGGVTSGGLVDDCEALLASEAALVGTGTGLNWGTGTAMGSWDGVTLSGGRVSELSLPSHGLAGTIPGEMGDLSSLTRLRLHGNRLTGAIPSELDDLSSLTELRLHSNRLTGAIPSTLDDLSNLTELRLSNNMLTGEIPAELGDMISLTALSLGGNALTGEIPTELGDLLRLTELGLSSNMLTGEIPAELGDLYRRLTHLNLSGNALTGEIPAELGDLSNLIQLHLNGNALTGEIPAELGDLSSLAWFQIHDNSLTGCIPVKVQALALSATLSVFSINPQSSGVSLPVCPGTPTLTLAAGDAEIVALWTVPSGITPTGYDVEYRLTSANAWTDAGHTGTVTTVTIGSLVNGSEYEGRVRAKVAGGAGEWSAVVSATPAAGAKVLKVAITGVPAKINSTTDLTATFTFSENVTGFETGDVTVTNGTKGTFTAVSATVYTLVVTPSSGSDLTVTVAANSATDSAGNTGPAAAVSATAVWDGDAPTVTITGVPEKINATTDLTATFTFSENVTGFATGDVTVTNGTKGTFTASSAKVYTLLVTPTSGSDLTVTVAQNAATDSAGNTGPAAAASATATWDATAPTVTITGVPATINATTALTATFTFSEDVTGFETGDVTVTNGTKGAFTASNAKVYTLVVTPTSGSNLTVTVTANSATDGDGNTGPLAAVSATATWDTPAPTNVLISNIGKMHDGVANFALVDSAQGFSTGAHSDGYTLESVQVVAFTALGSDVRVRVTSGTPGGSTIATLTNPASLAAGTLTFSAPSGTTLAASATYYVVLDTSTTGFIGLTNSDSEDSGGESGWSIEDSRRLKGKGTVNWTTGSESLRIRVNGVAKGTSLISNIGQTNNGNASFGNAVWAQGFTTGAHSNGYTLESVEVVAIAALGSDVSVRVTSGTPGGSIIATLTRPSSVAAGTLTFTAPSGTTLAASTTYYVVLDTTTTGSIGYTNSDSEDSGGAAGWSIGDSRHFKGSGNWTAGSGSLRIRVNGVAKDSSSPTITIAAGTSPVTEGTDAQFTVTADPAPAADLTVNLTVSESAGSDYVASGDEGSKTVTISANTTSATYSVPTQADTTDEPNGSVTVAVAAGTGTGYRVGTSSSASVTVTDDADTSVLISNIGKMHDGVANFALVDSAQGFSTGAHSDGYTLESVQVVAFTALGSDVRVRVTSGTPGGSTIATLTNPASLAAGTLTFSAPSGTTLAASATYYVVLDTSTTGFIGLTNSDSEDSGGESGWSIEDSRRLKGKGTVNWTTGSESLRIRVNGVAKGTSLISNIGQTNNGNASFGNAVWAQGFTTGAHSNGYTLESVEVVATADLGSNVRARVASGTPGGSIIATLTRPSSVAAGTLTFTAPSGTTLAASTTYYVVLDTTTTGSIGYTNSDSEDSGGASGWSIGDSRHFKGTGNWKTASGTLRIRVNGVANVPRVTITGVPEKINATTQLTATFTFSEAVTGFETGDVTVTGGTKGTFTASSATEYTLVVTPASGSDLTVTVTANAATDGVNTGPAAAVSAKAVWDATAPTVAITGVPARINATTQLTATFTFSEDVTGFATGDVTVTNGTKGTFTASSAKVYTLLVTPASGSDLTVTVTANAATDGVNTGPAAAVSAKATWDATAPTVELVGNFSQTASAPNMVLGGSHWHAQRFTTGANTGGYTLTNVKVDFTATPGSDISVKIVSGLTTSSVGRDVATLTNPASLSTGMLTFTAPTNTTLDASTEYAVVVNKGFSGQMASTAGTGESGATGWTIADQRSYSVDGSDYSHNSRVLRFQVNGAANVDTTVPTLESAAVDGTALRLNYSEALDTGSVPATTDFTVSVAGTDQTPTGVAVSGQTVTLTLGTAATAGQTVTLSYTKPGTNPIRDLAGNDAAAISNRAVTNVTGDTTVPTFSSATVDGKELVVTFSEALDTASVPATTDFTVSVAGTDQTPTNVEVSGSAVTLTLSTAATAGQTVTVSYTKGTNPIQDLAGNDAAALSSQSVTNNTASPAITIAAGTSPVTEGTNAQFTVTADSAPGADLTVNLTVSESAGSDYVASGDEGPKTVTISGSTTSATYNVTTQADTTDEPNGSVTVTVAAGTGYTVGTTSSASVSVNDDDADTTAPTVAITGVPARINATTQLTATFTFSEDVTGFATGDVTVTNGTKGTFTASSAKVYTLAVTPTSGSDLTVTVTANAATDGVNTGPAAAVSAKAVWDATAPTVAITGVPAKINATTQLTATFTFSEDVTGFATGDVTVTGGTKGTFTASSAKVYTLVVTPTSGSDLTVTVTANAATDGVNTGPAAAVSAKAVWDATAPTVAITGVPARINATTALTATFTFSEDVTGFETGDVTVTNGTKGTFTASNAKVYTLVVTPTSGSNLTVTVAQNAATDGANTGPAAATSATATWDGDAPAVAITGVPAKINATTQLTATFTFSEDVTGFATGDVTVTNGTKGTFTASSAKVYTLAVTPSSGKDLTVTVAQNAATDSVGNTGPAAAVSAKAVWDVTAPTVTITGVPAKINATTQLTATFTFSEDVTGFATGDVTVTNGTKGTFTASSAKVYTLVVTPTSGSDLTVTVTANAATDGANTGPAAAVSAKAVWDTTVPTFSSATVDGKELVVTFSEALDTGSVPATTDFTVSVAGTDQTPTNVEVSGSAVTLTLSTAATGGQTVTVTYTKGTNPIQDLAGNDAAALSSQAVTNNTTDTTAPTLSSATVNGDKLKLNYSEALDTTSVPATTDFTVSVGGTDQTPSEVSVFGSAVTLILGTQVFGQTVTVTYTKGTNPIQDLAGNDAAALSSQAVTNNNASTPTIDLVRIISAPTHDADSDGVRETYIRGDKILVDVEYSEPVKVTGTPRLRLQLGDDATPANNRKQVNFESKLHGGRTLRFAYTVAASDADTTGVWVETSGTNKTVVFLPSGATIKSAENDAAAGLTRTDLSTTGDANAKVDGTKTATDTGPRPTGATVNGATLEVTFDKTLDTSVDTSELPLYFDVRGTELSGGHRNAYQHPSAVAFHNTDNMKLVLTLGEAARAGDEVTLGYTLINHTGPLKDTDDKVAPAFIGLAVTNNTAGTAGPAPSRASVRARTLQLVFDGDLDTSSAPAGSAFLVETGDRDDDRRSIAGTGTATVSGATVTVELDADEEPVGPDDLVRVSYTPPTSNPLQNTPAGNDVLAFERFRVETVLDGIPPGFVGGEAMQTSSSPAASKVVIYFDEPLDTSSVPGTGDFPLLVGGNVATISSIAVEGDAVTLTLSRLLAGGTVVSLGYASGSDTIVDLAGNAAAGFTHGITASTAAKPALQTSGTGAPAVDGASLTLTYDLPLNPAKVPAADSYTLHYQLASGETDRDEYHLDTAAVAVRHKKIVLQLDAPVYPCDPEPTVSYVKKTGGPNVQGIDGQAADAITHQAVTNKRKGSCTRSQGVSGNSGGQGRSFTLKFERTLDTGRALQASAFRLAGASAPSVTGAAYTADAAGVALTLDRALAPGETFEARYERPVGEPGLWDTDGKHIADFSGVTVMAPEAPAVTGVEVISDPGSDGTYALGETVRMRVTFDEAVEVTGAPRLRIDMDPAAHWGMKWASYEGGSGRESLTFAYEVVQPNISTQGIAVLADTLEANGGAIRAVSGGADAHLSHPGLGHDPAHKVDWRLAPAPAANVPAAGAPMITGTAQVGETLTADTSGISDADGLDNAVFSYQWLADDADISGATSSTYTLATADEGKAIKLKVSFTDDAGNDETLTSEATAAVTPQP